MQAIAITYDSFPSTSYAVSVVLGAPDPEMNEIERVAREIGAQIVYGLTLEGQRVNAGEAYAVHRCSEIPVGERLFAIECDGPAVRSREIRVDHHRPGDPGYGLPPSRYLEGSSLGQFLHHIGIQATDEQRIIAAADHCLPAAYLGECPGVDPDAVARFRMAQKAAFTGRSVDELLDDIARAREALRNAQTVELGGQQVRDMRGAVVPELPDAASRDGAAYIALVRERDGKEKVVVGGHLTPGAVDDFIRSWAPAQGLTGIYGDPSRGFAGGYLTTA
jgi:hypothetical protein